MWKERKCHYLLDIICPFNKDYFQSYCTEKRPAFSHCCAENWNFQVPRMIRRESVNLEKTMLTCH